MGTSKLLFKRSKRVTPGGVHSPVRAFGAVGGQPFYVDRAKGPWIYSADGRRYLDYVMSWGPLILGHAYPAVTRAVDRALTRGMTFGACHVSEVELCERIREAFPSMEQIRLVNSGTEAAASAVRLARAATGRSLIVKFSGGYHGHVDSLLVKAGSGLATFGLASSQGIPPELARQTVVVPFNHKVAVEKAFRRWGNRIAACIVEPVPANMGVLLPRPGFLQTVRRLTETHGALLIFDEVITGFRLIYGGAQTLYGVRPDLTLLGKIIGGGLPVGAFGGTRKLMQWLAPVGPVYQAGTLSGNPLAAAAGLATLDWLARHRDNIYPQLRSLAERLENGFKRAAGNAGIPLITSRVENLMSFFFATGPVFDAETAQKASGLRYRHFFHGMLDQGFYFPPSPFEAIFLSSAHTRRDIDRTVDAFGTIWQRK